MRPSACAPPSSSSNPAVERKLRSSAERLGTSRMRWSNAESVADNMVRKMSRGRENGALGAGDVSFGASELPQSCHDTLQNVTRWTRGGGLHDHIRRSPPAVLLPLHRSSPRRQLQPVDILCLWSLSRSPRQLKHGHTSEKLRPLHRSRRSVCCHPSTTARRRAELPAPICTQLSPRTVHPTVSS